LGLRQRQRKLAKQKHDGENGNRRAARQNHLPSCSKQIQRARDNE
jgi:hypothetical protein